MQQTGHNASEREFQRHGLVVMHHGFVDTHSPTTRGAHPTIDPAQRLATTLPTREVGTDHYVAACTGDLFELNSGGHVLVAGSPYFDDPALRDTSNTRGPAAAVAAAFERDGEAVFAALRGAFCCVIVDTAGSRLLAAIDRLGQHSLYYQYEEGQFTLGTSAGAVLGPNAQSAPLSSQGIYNYVYFHMVPGPNAVFTGLDKLQASHYLRLENNHLDIKPYWLPQFTETTRGKSFRSMCDELKPTLRDAVRNTLPTTGKVGAFLSGGLDSSTVTGILAELTEGEVQAYSIGFSAEGYDEMPFARTTAKHFGVNLNEYYVTPQDVVDALPLVATSYDEPFGNSSALPAYFCARMAAQDGVDTLLAGDGGDELFAGNERYDKQRVFEHYAKVPTALRRGLLEPVIALLPRSLPLVGKANSYIDQANMPLPDRLQSYNFLHRHAANEIFSDEFVAQVQTELPLEIARNIYHRPEQASDLSRMLYLDWQITLADNDIRKVSHMCALAGVDVTYPMLDDALLMFSNTVPSQWKLKPGDLRHFYKEALTGWLPHETIHKSKQGFGLPFGVWMRTYAPLREMAYDNLLALKKRGFIRPEFIDRTIEMHQSEHAAYYGELVWIFTVFELWMSARGDAVASVTEA
jgi:asparagine synthase (glutamine-hydrolysing)